MDNTNQNNCFVFNSNSISTQKRIQIKTTKEYHVLLTQLAKMSMWGSGQSHTLLGESTNWYSLSGREFDNICQNTYLKCLYILSQQCICQTGTFWT